MHRILVVDDEEPVRSVLTTFLTRQGFLVEEAEDGAQALSILNQSQPDLVLLDITMPKMSGLEVLDWINRRYPDLCVIMLTGLDQNEIGLQAMKLGATDYLTKPIGLEQLKTHLAIHLLLRSDHGDHSIPRAT